MQVSMMPQGIVSNIMPTKTDSSLIRKEQLGKNFWLSIIKPNRRLLTVSLPKQMTITAYQPSCRTARQLIISHGMAVVHGRATLSSALLHAKSTELSRSRATVSIARKPKYFLGIKIHRAIVQIAWTLTTEYSDTQVVAVLNLDPQKSDAEKAAEVNAKIQR
jgi:hypothetical protein